MESEEIQNDNESNYNEDQNNARNEGPKTEDFEYSPNYKEKYFVDSDLPGKLSTVYEIIGQDASKRYNYYFLNEQEILMSVANTFQIFNIETQERKIHFSTEVGGIGAVTVHPSLEYFAIGECGNFPNIYIYRYKEEKVSLHRILRKGTEAVYSALTFDEKGELLASVGGEPDYNLVIWRWKNETIILKAKAFSQEVYRVAFSSNFEGKSITSGMGHIKFWEMAKTFTGLKLQGELGKFGQIDLSDISSFVEFPDGKVLSGTEHGTFLLWEGIFIKANLDEGEGKKCHEGLVEHMSWELSDDPSETKIMSAGHDGYVKWWKYLDIENVMLDDFSNGVIQPLKSVRLINPSTKKPIKIMNLVKYKDFWLIQDGNGFLIKVTPKENEEEYEYKIITGFHSGRVIKSIFIPGKPIVITQGIDERVSVSTYESFMKHFPERIILEHPQICGEIKPVCCDLPKRETAEDPFIIAVGYNNGMFKIFTINPIQKKLEIVFQSRPHEESIGRIKFSPDGSYLCTSTKKEIFFFIVESFDKISPWCCIQPAVQISDIDWHFDSKKLLVGYINGTLEEIDIPIHFDNTKTFILEEYTKQTFKVKQAENQIEKMDEKKRQRLLEQGKLKEEPEPGIIYSCKYIGLYQEDDFLVTSQKPYNEFLYLCTFNMEETNIDRRPVNFWKLPLCQENYIKHISKNYVFISNQKGSLQIRHKKIMEKYVEIFPNLPGCQISDVSTSEDEKLICICFDDGTTIINSLDTEGFEMQVEMFSKGITEEKQQEFNERKFEAPTFEKQEVEGVITQIKQGEMTGITDEIDVTKLLSLEDDKKQAQEREKERIANEKKEKLLTKVTKLREDFNKLKSLNNKLPEEIRLTQDEIVIDEKYLEIIEDEKKANLEDVENKYKWLKANVSLGIDKIQTFLLSSVETGKVVVYGLRTDQHVSTLRCPALPKNFNETLSKLEEDIEEFSRRIDFDSLNSKYMKLIDSNKTSEEEERKQVEDLIIKGKERKESQESKVNCKQIEIEPEIEETKCDVKAIQDLLDSKTELKKKIMERFERKKGNKKSKLNQKNDKNRNALIYYPCPEIYNLKLKYDKNSDEKNMLTNKIHLKKIYQFLQYLFQERQKFNKRIHDLQAEKADLISKLINYRKEIEGYNEILEIEETFDWYNFQNKDTVEDLMKIPEKELDEYMKKKIQEDPELKAIDDREKEELKKNLKANNNNEDDEIEWKFEVKERHNKQVNETNLENEHKRLRNKIYLFKKEKVLKEINQIINDFDNKLESLKKEKTLVSFYQKLGEYELILKHKELNKLRAFEKEDKKLCDRLIKLFEEYKTNLENLNRNHDYVEENQRELHKEEEKLREKEAQFERLIENEKENREQLLKIFLQRKKETNKEGGDVNLDQEEEFNLPKSITNQTKHELFALRDGRDYIMGEIQKYNGKVQDFKKKKEEDIRGKNGLDEKRRKLREKICANEKQKEQYINQIDQAMPIALDQFMKISPSDGRTLPELGKAIFITQRKVQKLDQELSLIAETNANYERQEKDFSAAFDEKTKKKREREKEFREQETEFKNEQILKFGLEIDFNFLLQASKKTTFDRYENEYKKLKLESDRKIDAYKQKIVEAKEQLRIETGNNTAQLTAIKKQLEKKQENDKLLEEKNSEITKKNSKKFVMYDLKEKKMKLKEILKLLKQQMEALKKEIDIFRRKGGHIYSTIASNLV